MINQLEFDDVATSPLSAEDFAYICSYFVTERSTQTLMAFRTNSGRMHELYVDDSGALRFSVADVVPGTLITASVDVRKWCSICVQGRNDAGVRVFRISFTDTMGETIETVDVANAHPGETLTDVWTGAAVSARQFLGEYAHEKVWEARLSLDEIEAEFSQGPPSKYVSLVRHVSYVGTEDSVATLPTWASKAYAMQSRALDKDGVTRTLPSEVSVHEPGYSGMVPVGGGNFGLADVMLEPVEDALDASLVTPILTTLRIRQPVVVEMGRAIEVVVEAIGSDSRPFPGATINLTGSSRIAVTGTPAFTDAKGLARFTVTGIYPGTFKLRVTSPQLNPRVVSEVLTPPLDVDHWIVRPENPTVAVPNTFLGLVASNWPYSGTGRDVPFPPDFAFGSASTYNYTNAMWAQINPALNIYDWTALDNWYAPHAAANRSLHFQFFGTPEWARSNDILADRFGSLKGLCSMPARSTYVTTFIRALLLRYPLIDSISVWNSPDFPHDQGSGVWQGDQSGLSAWTGTNVEMATLTRWVAEAAKSVRDTIKIVGWDMADMRMGIASLNYVGNKFERVANASDDAGGKGSDWIDVYAWRHVDTSAAGHFDATDFVLQTLAQLGAVRARTGWLSKPVWLTELSFAQWLSGGSTATENEKVRMIRRYAMLIAATGHQRFFPFSYDSASFGHPSTNPAISAALDDIGTNLAGKTIAQAAILRDATVWLAFTDGSQMRA